MSATTIPSAPPRTYDTATTARVLQVTPHTLRVSLCQKGEYYGLKPCKAPNRRLIWSADAVDALARGQAPVAAPPAPPTPSTTPRRRTTRTAPARPAQAAP